MRHTAAALIPVALLSLAAVAPTVSPPPVVLNEVAWAGAAGDPTAEWIELFNTSSEPIDLDGWRLVSSDGSPDVALRGRIEPHVAGDPTTGFFLLEREDDEAVPDVAADLVYHGALNDRGEALYLFAPGETLVDSANDDDAIGRWPAGTDAQGVPPFASMERTDYRLADEPNHWANSTAERSTDSPIGVIRGTPRTENSTFNIAPTPSFSMEPADPRPGTPVAFDASASFDENDRIAAYHWDFGDGTQDSGATVAHTWSSPAEYRVVLTVTDEKGATSERTRIVRVRITSPPVADFSVVSQSTDRTLRAGSPIRFQDESSDVDGEIVGWEWSFGDDTSASSAVAEHTYDRDGEYLIWLLVLDDQGETAIQTRSVTVASRVPIARLEIVPERPEIDASVRLDASASFDPDGHPEAYRWDLDGDGTYELETSAAIVDHAFETGGEHTVRLIVVDDAGDRSTAAVATLHVNLPPTAGFHLSAFESNELLPIRFADTSYDEDGTIADRQWDFGDGTTSGEVELEHAFDEDGTFVVSLRVTDDAGAQRTTTAQILVSNLPPIAELTAEATSHPTGEPFRFDASASTDPSPGGSIVQYEWDLDGDGTFDRTTADPTLSHAYEDHDSFDVVVRVTDDDGAVTVSAPVSVRVTNRSPRVDRVAWTPTTPTDDADVAFVAEASDPDGRVVQWFWDFGDEVVIVGSGPIVRFPDDGRHTVLVSVQDDDGARSDPVSVDVFVDNAPPVAEFSVTNAAGPCVTFDARGSRDPSPDGEIVHVAWDFGDGIGCPGSPDGCGSGDRWAPAHCYSRPGTYTVTLVVIDEQGALARFTKIVRIAE